LGIVLLNKIIVLLNKVSVRSSNNSFSTCIFRSHLLFNIKSLNKSIHGELLSVVLQ
jgi:hypothetical protein